MTERGRLRFLPLTLLLAAAPVHAQEAVPAAQTALSAAYGFTTQDDSNTWITSQNATLGLSGRWGQGLKLDSQLTAAFDGSPLKADTLIKQLELTWDVTPWAIVTFGKQRLKWGTARVFSAIDSLEPTYDPLHPNAVLDGVTGVKLEVLPNEWLSASFLALPAPLLEDTKAAARFDVLWDDTDLSFGAVRSVTVQGKHQQGVAFADFSRFFDRFGLYGEAEMKVYRDQDWRGTADSGAVVVSSGTAPDWTPKATVGLQIDFPAWLNGTITWLSEYHYNGAGFSSAEAVPFDQAWNRRTSTTFAAPAGLTVGTFSRHYGYSGLSGIPLTEKLSMGTAVLAGLDTGFLLGRVSADYRVDQRLSVDLVYSRYDKVPGSSSDAGELAILSMRNQVALTVTGTY